MNKIKKKCKECNKEFSSYYEKATFCSKGCFYNSVRGKERVIYEERKCLNCGANMRVLPRRIKEGRGKYCSKECFYEGISNKVKMKCKNCGNEFKIKRYKYKIGRKYCGNDCQLSDRGRATLISCKQCGKEFKDTEGTFCSRSCYHKYLKGRKKIEMRGKNSPHWKGGTTDENKRMRKRIEFRLWRESIFTRDNWTCQKCKERGGELHPHHIYSFADYPKLRFEIDNGITFCKKCHKEFHKIYGKRHSTKEQLKNFYLINDIKDEK